MRGGDWANCLFSMLSEGANHEKTISSKQRLGLGCLPQSPHVWKELMDEGNIGTPVVNGTHVTPAGAGGAGLES